MTCFVCTDDKPIPDMDSYCICTGCMDKIAGYDIAIVNLKKAYKEESEAYKIWQEAQATLTNAIRALTG